MTLSEFATFSTAISGIAVTVSLIYLAIQTHQNTRNTRALIHQGAAARTNSILIGLMEGEFVAAWLEGNGARPTPEAIRQRQFLLHCGTAVNAMEDHYLQHQAGLLSDEQYARNTETFRGLLQEPGMRAYWTAYKPSVVHIAPRFCAFVDGLCTAEVTAFGNRV